MCFSATLEASVAHLVHDYMKTPVRLAFGSTLKPSENVHVRAFEVSADRKQDLLYQLLAKETGRCLVFARTKRGTERLAKNLARDGFAAAMIHGDRSQSQRNAALAGFQQGRYRILVATDLASRGIHVQDIKHVINYDLPEMAENFIHRVGRTGRAGGQGIASTLFGRDQRSELLQLERTLGIQMERMQADAFGTGITRAHDAAGSARTDYPASTRSRESRPSASRNHAPSTGARRDTSRIETTAAPFRMARLPGEILQAQDKQ